MCSSFCLPLYIYVLIFLSSSSSLYSCVHFLFSYRSTHMDDVCIIPKSLLYRMILSGHHLLREELGEQLLFCTCPYPFPTDYHIMPYRIMSYHVMSSLCYHYSVILPLFCLDFLSDWQSNMIETDLKFIRYMYFMSVTFHHIKVIF